jgi:hypothetical protein
MYDLIAAITVQAEDGNHLLLPVAHLRYLRAHQGFSRALRNRRLPCFLAGQPDTLRRIGRGFAADRWISSALAMPRSHWEVTALRWGRIHSDQIEIVERFYESEFDDTKTDAGRGASRLIPPEFCVVRWMQIGSAQSIAIRGS